MVKVPMLDLLHVRIQPQISHVCSSFCLVVVCSLDRRISPFRSIPRVQAAHASSTSTHLPYPQTPRTSANAHMKAHSGDGHVPDAQTQASGANARAKYRQLVSGGSCTTSVRLWYTCVWDHVSCEE